MIEAGGPVVCLGDLMVDVVAIATGPTVPGSDTEASVRISGGGSAANTAAWLATVGHPVAYVGRVGDDTLGRAALDELHAAGVDVRVALDLTLPTGTCVVVVDSGGERTMFPDAGANARLSPSDLPLDLLARARVLHLSGYPLLREGSRDAALAAVAAARFARTPLSVDASSVAPLAAVGAERWLAWVDGADLLLANEDEARLLAGRSDAAAAGRSLARRFGEVVVKQGAAGASWFRTGQVVLSVPAPPATVVDTTGAGDAFAAGFLSAWQPGGDPSAALAAGAALAARVVAGPGARP